MKITMSKNDRERISNYYKSVKENAIEGCKCCPCCENSSTIIIKKRIKKGLFGKKLNKLCYQCCECGATWESDWYVVYDKRIGKNAEIRTDICPFCQRPLTDCIVSSLNLDRERAKLLYQLLRTTNLADCIDKFVMGNNTGKPVEVDLHFEYFANKKLLELIEQTTNERKRAML